MNPLADAFEIMLVKKVFLWSCVFFIALTVAIMLSQFLYTAPFQQSMVFLLTVRSVILLFNTAVLIWLVRYAVADAFFPRIPAIVTSVNFMLTLISRIGSGDNILVAMGSYLIFSLIYLIIFGFFIRNQLFTACLGFFLIAGAVVLFVILPDRLYTQRLGMEELRSALLYILFFGLVLAAVLVTLKNQFTSMIIRRTRETAERLRTMAFFDHSTGFPNGLQLEQDMKMLDEIAHPAKEGKLVMVGFRLEGLEALNETRGLEFTDSLVREIALSYRNELGVQIKTHPEYVIPEPFSPMYRVESNSFLYVLTLPDSGKNFLATKSILASIIERLVLEQQGRISLTFQGGFSIYPDDAGSLAQLFRNLLNLLHSRRNESLGQFVCFNPEHYREFVREEQLRSCMEEALPAGEFSLVYQPKIEVASGRLKGFEALARWRSAEFGTVSPAEFIPLAEQSGAIERLTVRLMEAVYRFVSRLREENRANIRVSVNLSPGLLKAAFLDRIIDDIEKNGLGPSLELEITEGVLMKLNPLVSAKFGVLKRLGVAFSIDDFGTGYSNLGYLQKFEADVLKIDKRFIDGIPLDAKNGKLVEAILQMARSFNMLVVAEGVEYREQKDYLQELGCDQIQGYFYSKPLLSEDALEFALQKA